MIAKNRTMMVFCQFPQQILHGQKEVGRHFLLALASERHKLIRSFFFIFDAYKVRKQKIFSQQYQFRQQLATEEALEYSTPACQLHRQNLNCGLAANAALCLCAHNRGVSCTENVHQLVGTRWTENVYRLVETR